MSLGQKLKDITLQNIGSAVGHANRENILKSIQSTILDMGSEAARDGMEYIIFQPYSDILVSEEMIQWYRENDLIIEVQREVNPTPRASGWPAPATVKNTGLKIKWF